MFRTDAKSQLFLRDFGTEFAVHLIAKLFIPVIITLTDGTKQSADNVAESKGGVVLGSITFTVLCVIKLYRRFHNNIFNTAELFIIFKRNVRRFLFVVKNWN